MSRRAGVYCPHHRGVQNLLEQSPASPTTADAIAYPRRDALERGATLLTSALLLVTLWMITHQYAGLGGDAGLYAVQALAHIHPNLLHDLFLQNTSQDSYTIFSRIYAASIALMSLRGAALALAIACKVWFFAAAWMLARELLSRDVALITVCLLIITPGGYGAFGVFHYAEDWLTARSLAEPMVITAVVLFFRGARAMGFLTACVAMLIHPLMVLPGVLLLLCLGTSPRVSLIGAVAGLLMSLGIGIVAWGLGTSHGLFALLDAQWLEVVRERSQFLFLQRWRAADWRQNALPFISLILSASAIDDARVRRLCAAAILVGATGLAVALVGSVLGPVALLLQGQAWRWVWVTQFMAVLLLAPTIVAVWRHEKLGLLCALLTISAWTVALDGAACMACALLAWSLKERIPARAAPHLRWLNLLLIALIGAWIIERCIVGGSRSAADDASSLVHARQIFGVNAVSLAIAWLIRSWIRAPRSVPALAAVCVALVTVSGLFLPSAFAVKATGDDMAFDSGGFADWRNAIPADSNVFVLPSHNSAKFAWIMLERPSYLTVDQSSGVVFSRATALEVRRRSQVLLPLMNPDWMLLSDMTAAHNYGAKPSPTRPLTRDRLIAICTDQQLNFVVARESVGFDPMRYERAGPWKDWNLYDCRRVSPVVPHER
jgi:hypothetical protein